MSNPRNEHDPIAACNHEPTCADFWPCAIMGESLHAHYAKTAARHVHCDFPGGDYSMVAGRHYVESTRGSVEAFPERKDTLL